jgi:class 3 adenylate cyclase
MTTADFKRKLAAIFMADVVGYSRLMGEDEAATLTTLTTYQGVMTGLIKQHRGRVVDAPGDAFLAEFSSVVDAVQCAVAVQKELQARNNELPEASRMQFRIGINLGDVIEEGDKIYGDGVNIAARLEALAEPGGICISKTAFDHIETKLPLGYEFLGEKEVKNIARPVKAYRVLLEPRITVAGEVAQLGPRPRRTSTAVVAGSLLVALAAVLVVVWQAGLLGPRPAKDMASTGAPAPGPAPPQAAPAPQAAVSPQAAAPSPKVPIRKKAPPPPAAPLPAKPSPPPAKALPPEAPPTPLASVPRATSAPPAAPLPQATPPAPAAPPVAAVPPTRPGPLSRGRGLSDLFQRLDPNGDGKVTMSEFQSWREGQFNAFDADKDGHLSQAELSAGRSPFARKLLQNFSMVDSDQDQKLSRSEFQAGGRRRFLQMDANRDGNISGDEMKGFSDQQAGP